MQRWISTHKDLFIGVGTAVGAAVFGAIFIARIRASGLSSNKVNMEALQKASVRMRDRARVEKVIEAMVAAGSSRLQVIADFDRTLSCHAQPDGTICDTCHNAMDMSPRLPDSYRQEAVKVRDMYYPIEIDPNLTIQEKYPYMIEWWTKAHKLLLQCGLTRDTLVNIVTESSIRLRADTQWMFSQLHKVNVPLLIFSAGIGDVIEEVVKQQAQLYDNMRIVSNYMDFNTQGQLVGFQGELIHTYNKNEAAIHKSDYFERLQCRDQVILLGDSLGDLRMADGCGSSSNLLKIGFLNVKIEERLESYLDAYDIVLISDETMDVPNAILKKVL